MYIPMPWLIGILVVLCVYIYALHRNIRVLRFQHKFAIGIAERFFEKVNADISKFEEMRDAFIFKFAGLQDFKMIAPPDDEIFDAMYESGLKQLNDAGFDSVDFKHYTIDDVC